MIFYNEMRLTSHFLIDRLNRFYIKLIIVDIILRYLACFFKKLRMDLMVI